MQMEVTLIQNHDNGESYRDTQDHTTSNSFNSPIYYTHKKELFSQKKDYDKKIDEYSSEETPSSIENQNLNHVQDLNNTQDEVKEKITSENKDNINSGRNIIDLRFSIPFGVIREPVTLFFQGARNDDPVRFHVRLDSNTKEVIFARLEAPRRHE